jgi:hypothetical protein
VLRFDIWSFRDFPALFEEFKERQFTILFCSVAGRLRWFQSETVPSPLRRACEPLTVIWEHFRLLHPRGVGPQNWRQDRLASEEFPFHVEESAQRPGAEICVEGQKEERGNLV